MMLSGVAAVIFVAAAGLAYADHVDNHIWLDTAEGGFIVATETTLNAIELIRDADSYLTYAVDGEYRDEVRVTIRWGKPHITVDGDKYSDKITLNEVQVVGLLERCESVEAERDYIDSLGLQAGDVVFHSGRHYPIISVERDHLRQPFHESVCGYLYSNVVKDEYTYTIIDLPRDREIPPDYNSVVRDGVAAGLNAWAKINDMNFTYTDSRLDADIIVQQQIGNGRMYGNAEIGCLFDHKQCTMQLFTDINVRDQQTLVNKHSIAWTTAHEFGHMIGLPHHIDPDHIMNTVHSNDVRTYYETRNINVVMAPEPTYEQRLLGYEGDVTFTTDYTDITHLLEHATTIEFIEFVKEIAANAGPSILAEYIDALVARITN